MWYEYDDVCPLFNPQTEALTPAGMAWNNA
jgi:hypothetical protein